MAGRVPTWGGGGADKLDAALLVSLLAQRSSDEAAATGNCFLQTCHGLLCSLIGASLTERLLRTVWGTPEPSLKSPTPQDSTP